MNICGNCLHDREAHTEDGNRFMYCAICKQVCEIDEFNKINKPTDKTTLFEISAKRSDFR